MKHLCDLAKDCCIVIMFYKQKKEDNVMRKILTGLIIVKSKLFFILNITLLIVSCVSLSAHAIPVTFFGEDISNVTPGSNEHVVISDFVNANAARDDFANYLDATTWFENFEGYSDTASTANFHTVTQYPAEFTANFGDAGNATISGNRMELITRKNSLPGWCGTYPTSGDQYLGVSTNGTDAKFELTFDEAQSAFGFFATDFETAPLNLTFENLAGEKMSLETPYTRAGNGATRINNGSVFFFGLIDVDNPFTKVTFETNSTWEGFGFDDFTIATREQIVDPVPEPGTWLLMTVGLGAMIWVRRRRV